MADNVGADGRIEREAEHAVAGRVDQHGGRAVDDVAGGDLAVAGLKHIDHRVAISFGVRLTAQDREDRADADVDVDVAGAVERIEDDHVLAMPAVALDDDRFLVFFRGHDGDVAAVAQTVQQRLVRKHVELLHGLALHVGSFRRTQHIHQPGPANLRGDHLRG